jgi:hypothetical protein
VGPASVAFDSANNAWIANSAFNAPNTGNSVTVLGAVNGPTAGQPLGFSPLEGLISPEGLAFDQSDFAWITNPGANNVVVLIRRVLLPPSLPSRQAVLHWQSIVPALPGSPESKSRN